MTFIPPLTNADAAKALVDWERFEFTPEGLRLRANMNKISQGRRYRLFFEQAGLTAAQIDALENSLVENAFKIRNPSWTDEGQRVILGDQMFQQLKEYDRTRNDWGMIKDLTTSAALAGAALSSEQKLQLAQLVATSSSSYAAGGAVTFESVDWAQLQAEAQSLLSPPQWKAAEGTILSYQYQSALKKAQHDQASDPAARAGAN
jgi:hypothetical protein